MVKHLSLVTLCSTLLILSGCGECKKAETAQPVEEKKTEQAAPETGKVADLYNNATEQENKIAEAEVNNNVVETEKTEAPVKM